MAWAELSEPWTYRSPLVTIKYPAGKHNLSAEVEEAAIKAGVVKESAYGDRDSETGSQAPADDAENE